MKKVLSFLFIVFSTEIFGSYKYHSFYFNGNHYSISESEIMLSLLILIGILIVCFIPTLITKKNIKIILILNIFLIWTVIGWLILLITVIIRNNLEISVFCPYCKEKIKKDAIVCKHCQKSLTEQK